MISGPKLRAFRERRNVMQSDVATRLGVTRNAVRDMESRTVGLGAAERYLNAVHLAYTESEGFAPITFRVRAVVTAEGADRTMVDGAVDELKAIGL